MLRSDVEVAFATKKLADTLSQDKARVKTYGDIVARKIAVRLNALKAANTLEDVRNVAGHCHELRENRSGQLAMTLTANLRLVFMPSESPPPRRPTADWIGLA